MRISDWSSDVCSSDLPGRVDPGAGQRYIQIPVGITATTSDGSVRRYAGTYTLHRTVVDGATAEQRAWRIASADLRAVKPYGWGLGPRSRELMTRPQPPTPRSRPLTPTSPAVARRPADQICPPIPPQDGQPPR